MNGVSGSSSRLPVQVVALHKDGVVAQAAHPHVPLALALQLHPFADVKPEDREVRPLTFPANRNTKKNAHPARGSGSPGSLDVLRSVDVAQLAQAEAVAAGRVHVAVHGHDGARRRHLESLADLHVHLEVGDGAPVLRGWGAKSPVKLPASASVRVFPTPRPDTHRGGWIWAAGRLFH